MKRYKNNKSFIPQPAQLKTPSIDDLLNKYFETEDKEDKNLQDFFKAFYSYLQKSREDKLEEIVDSLRAVADQSVNDKFVRIVQLKYGDPLSLLGSVVGPGKRFNIGDGMGHTKPFHSLYVANDFHTAYCECFHYPPSFLRGGIDAAKMGLQDKNNFINAEMIVNIEKCIDLRVKENLRGFTQVISEIKPTENFREWAKDLGYLTLRTVQSHGELYNTLLDSDFLKPYYSLEMPSNSQWFGYYCLMAGIQGIIFPSVRDSKGYNISVIADNLKETDSYVKLTEESDVIPDDRMILNGENVDFFKIKMPSKKTIN